MGPRRLSTPQGRGKRPARGRRWKNTRPLRLRSGQVPAGQYKFEERAASEGGPYEGEAKQGGEGQAGGGTSPFRHIVHRQVLSY